MVGTTRSLWKKVIHVLACRSTLAFLGLHGARPGTRQPLRSSIRRALASVREPSFQALGSFLPSNMDSIPSEKRRRGYES